MRWKLKTLQDEAQGVSGRVIYEDITKATGISPNSLSKMATNKAQRVDLVTLDRLLKFFSEKTKRQLEIGDLIEWVPDKNGA